MTNCEICGAVSLDPRPRGLCRRCGTAGRYVAAVARRATPPPAAPEDA